MTSLLRDPYPHLTRDVWEQMKCRLGQPCKCPVCKWESRNNPAFSPPKNQVPIYDIRIIGNQVVIREDPLPTLDSLLVSWATRRFHRSAAGSLIDRAHLEAAPPERSNTPWAIRKAETYLEVERAVRWAFSDPDHCYGLHHEICEGILLASIQLGTYELGDAITLEDLFPDVDSKTIRQVIKSGRKWTLVDLAARGMVETPKGTRDKIAVFDRTQELRRENE